MCKWFKKNKKSEESKSQTVKDIINQQITAYEEAIAQYADLYMKKFYDSWLESISSLQIHSIEENKEFTFTVDDDYKYRPDESITKFLDMVLSKHPDITWTVCSVPYSADLKSMDKYTFNYKNCLDDIFGE